MTLEAFVCPHCRTWVEGSGRVIRCSSCGKRFRADEARLGSHDASPSHAPPEDDRLFAYPEWDQPQTVAEQDREARHLQWDHPEPGEAAGPRTGDGRNTAEPQRAGPRLNPSMLLTFLILGLIFFGNRYLSGEIVLGAIFLLLAAQWLLRRSEHGGS